MKEKIPDKLSREAKEFYRKILQEYQIEDVAGLKLLLTACECLDRLRECQKIIKKEGMQIQDRFGQWKAHPLCITERDARSQFLLSLKALSLDVEPLKDGPGRPGGR